MYGHGTDERFERLLCFLGFDTGKESNCMKSVSIASRFARFAIGPHVVVGLTATAQPAFVFHSMATGMGTPARLCITVAAEDEGLQANMRADAGAADEADEVDDDDQDAWANVYIGIPPKPTVYDRRLASQRLAMMRLAGSQSPADKAATASASASVATPVAGDATSIQRMCIVSECGTLVVAVHHRTGGAHTVSVWDVTDPDTCLFRIQAEKVSAVSFLRDDQSTSGPCAYLLVASASGTIRVHALRGHAGYSSSAEAQQRIVMTLCSPQEAGSGSSSNFGPSPSSSTFASTGFASASGSGPRPARVYLPSVRAPHPGAPPPTRSASHSCGPHRAAAGGAGPGPGLGRRDSPRPPRVLRRL